MNGLYSCNNYVQCILGNFQYGGNVEGFPQGSHFLQTLLKEYETIT